MNDLDLLNHAGPFRFLYKTGRFLAALPRRIFAAGKAFFRGMMHLFRGIQRFFREIFVTYTKGDWKTKLSFTFMGFGSIARGQVLRGVLFFLFQTVFNLYMFLMGFSYLAKLPSLGTVETRKIGRQTVYGDNSFFILLYGVLTLFFILAFVYTWYVNIRQNRLNEAWLAAGKPLPTARQDAASLLDRHFHKTLLALPTLGVVLFTILPIFFMVLVAFTNYDAQHQPPQKLFHWVGTENFRSLLSVRNQPVQMSVSEGDGGRLSLTITARDGDVIRMTSFDAPAVQAAQTLLERTDADFSLENREDTAYRVTFFAPDAAPVEFVGQDVQLLSSPSFAATFRQVLLWTLIWAFFATFLNYFLGMLVAILINKKGIRLKKMWRTFLVMTIAVPQFISLLYVSKLFAADGLVNGLLLRLGWIAQPLPFWTDPTWARVTIILLNIWVGIPYVMLIATGILLNIPADLYESARIDGANAWQTFRKITLPYMLFVTGPYLLTSFTGNINNFNVIFLLSQGKPLSLNLAGNAGSTDLMITWLYKMTVTDSNFKLAAVIGILVFVVCAGVNLIVYNLIPSVKNEEDFQ